MPARLFAACRQASVQPSNCVLAAEAAQLAGLVKQPATPGFASFPVTFPPPPQQFFPMFQAHE
jgi:hypothetical protein